VFYQEFQFSNTGSLLGIKTLDYGLECNRLVASCKDESNFDIFYLLLHGATREEKAKWYLRDSSHYKYLCNYGLSSTFTQEDFLNLKKCLKSIGIGSKIQDQIFSLLSGILLLGEIDFQNDTLNKQEACSIKNPELLVVIADLFGVDQSSIGNALTFESKVIQNELCTLFLNEEEAVSSFLIYF
jgi:chitin synthase